MGSNNTSDNTSREQGIEFGSLRDDLKSYNYPATGGELANEFGDYEIGIQDTSESFGELIEEFKDESFDSTDDVFKALMTMVGDEAIGRKYYSDRSPSSVGEERPDEESF